MPGPGLGYPRRTPGVNLACGSHLQRHHVLYEYEAVFGYQYHCNTRVKYDLSCGEEEPGSWLFRGDNAACHPGWKLEWILVAMLMR